jgi:hypothetical protein
VALKQAARAEGEQALHVPEHLRERVAGLAQAEEVRRARLPLRAIIPWF